MRRLALLLGLAGLIAACDSGITRPTHEALTFTVTISGNAEESIGAALLNVAGTPDRVAVPGGWGLATAASGGTIVAAVLSGGRPTVRVVLDVVATEPPAVDLLQVAGSDNQVFPDPDAFTVDVTEVERDR